MFYLMHHFFRPNVMTTLNTCEIETRPKSRDERCIFPKIQYVLENG